MKRVTVISSNYKPITIPLKNDFLVRDLKFLLSKVHPLKPPVESQSLLYNDNILNDSDLVFKDIKTVSGNAQVHAM